MTLTLTRHGETDANAAGLVQGRGLDPDLKAVRAANYVKTLRRDLVKVAEAAGVEHPALIPADSIEILTGQTVATPLTEVYGYRPDWGFPSPSDRERIVALMG